MKAIVIPEPGDPEILRLEERPLPEPGPRQVRVRVRYAGLNRADTMQRRGQYPPPPDAPQDVPGLEVLGTVDAVGAAATQFKKGDRVFGIMGGGGYAEYALAEAALLMPVPGAMADELAAAVPESFLTAYDALLQAELPRRQAVLVHAIGSSVGLAALALAKHLLHGQVFGTSRSPHKLERARDLGLDASLPLPHFAAAARDLTGGDGVACVLDFVGAPYFEENLDALMPGGHLIQIGAMGGVRARLNLATLMSRRLRVKGTVLRSRPLALKASLVRRFIREVLPLLGEGALQPVVDSVFPLEQAAQAHRRVEENAVFGKVLLRVG